MIVTFLLLFFIRGYEGKTIGSDLDKKFQAIQSNFTNLKSRNQALQAELNSIKASLLSNCHPCHVRTVRVGDKHACDCTNMEPKKDCLEFYQHGMRKNGIYRIDIGEFTTTKVFCDQTSNGGGWTVIQRRINGSVDFYRNWAEYRDGFGSVDGETWLGNSNINLLTKSSNSPKSSTLLIDMKIKGKTKPVYAKYTSFHIDDESKKFMLHISGFSGNVTDQTNHMMYNNNMKFTTYDQDNDTWDQNCAVDDASKNAWWANNCSYVWLNGLYSYLRWDRTGAVTFSEMKIRRNL